MFSLVRFFFVLFGLFASCAASPPVVNIAILGGSFNNYVGEVFPDVATASAAGVVLNPLIQYGYQTVDYYISRLNAVGGIPLHDNAGTRVHVNYTIFNLNIALAYQPSPAALVTEHMTIASKIVSGAYGVQYAAIVHMLAPIPAIFANACDQSNSCVFIYAFSPPPSQFVCDSYRVNLAPTLEGDTSCLNKRVGFRRFENQFSPMPSYTTFLDTLLSIWRSLGLRRIAAITTELELDMDIYTNSKITMTDLGMKVTVDKIITATDAAWTDADADAIVEAMMASDTDAFIVYGIAPVELPNYLNNQERLLRSLKRHRWIPKAISLTVTTAAAMDPDLVEYVWQTFLWDEHLKGSNFRPVNSTNNLELFPASSDFTKAAPQVLSEAFQRDLPGVYQNFLVGMPVVIQSINIVQKFIETSGSLVISDWVKVSKVISLPSITGLMQFDGFGRIVAVATDLIVAQIHYDSIAGLSKYRVVAPASIGDTIIFPTPEWSIRVYESTRYRSSEESAILAVTSIIVIVALVFIYLTVKYWRSPEVKAATPWFLLLFSLGSLMMLASNYFANVDPSDDQCAAQIWLLTCGFTMMFGALFLKTLRISIIFNASQLRVKKIPTSYLSMALFALVLVDVVINAAWAGAGGMRAELYVPDPVRLSNNYHVCASGSADPIFLYITIGYKALLILFGLVLAWFSRHVDATFNESRYLAASIYTFTLVSALFVSTIGSHIAEHRANYVLTCIGVLIVCFSSLSLIFLPKFYEILRNLFDFVSFRGTSSVLDSSLTMNRNTNGTNDTNGTGKGKSPTHTVQLANKAAPSKGPSGALVSPTMAHTPASKYASSSWPGIDSVADYVIDSLMSNYSTSSDFSRLLDQIAARVGQLRARMGFNNSSNGNGNSNGQYNNHSMDTSGGESEGVIAPLHPHTPN